MRHDDDPCGFVTPRVALLVRVDIQAEQWDAVRAGELELTSGGVLPIHKPLGQFPPPPPPAARQRLEPTGGLW